MARTLRGIALALLLAACGGSQPVTGSFTLATSDIAYSPTSCSGTDGYSDVQAGLNVVVRDEAGKTIGTGTLAYDPAGSSASRCRYTFSVALTDDAKFYEIEVGHRGKLTYSHDEMEARGWKVELTLGS